MRLNGSVLDLLFAVIALFIAITMHEATRAVVSTILGDKTPKNEKRLTLNPLKHFEPIGFILLFFYQVGWGKPVNTNSRNYANRKSGAIITAIMPLVLSFITALFFNYILKYFVPYNLSYVRSLIEMVIAYNIALVSCNFIPVAPFGCSKVIAELMPSNTYFAYQQNEKIFQLIMLLLLFTGTLRIITDPLTTFFAILLNSLTF